QGSRRRPPVDRRVRRRSGRGDGCTRRLRRHRRQPAGRRGESGRCRAASRHTRPVVAPAPGDTAHLGRPGSAVRDATCDLAGRRLHRYRRLLPGQSRDAAASDVHPRRPICDRTGERAGGDPGGLRAAGRRLRAGPGGRAGSGLGRRSVGVADDDGQDGLHARVAPQSINFLRLHRSGTIELMAGIEMTRIDLRNRALSAAQLRAALPRGGVDVDTVLPAVRPVVEAVAQRGADAALEYGELFDGVRPAAVRVPAARLDDALTALGADVRSALEVAIGRARAVHADQRRTDTTTSLGPGATVTERWVPVARVGLYVPGGNAVYPSSVVMNVVPAQIAGVESLVIASPPQAQFDGLPHPTVLAAARLLGVDEVWAVGGAQAIALLAYGGTDTDGAELPPVDMITGPGNIYVTA